MQSSLFDNAYFLQSVGWAIAHSFWQAGLLWLLYTVIVRTRKQQGALAKYYLGVGFLLTIFAWFLFTIIGNYRVLSNPDVYVETPGFTNWIPTQSLSDALPFLSILYFSLLAAHGITFTRKLVSNYRIQVNGLSKAPVDFRLFTNSTAHHLGIRRSVKVWMSANVDVPSVTGFFKPVILLPVALINHLTVKQVEAILLHELAHIKRNDYLVNLFQSIVELVLFFNPFVGLLSRSISKERENCCDDWVVNFRFNKYDYASALLMLEEQRHHKLSFALAATNDKKTLLERIKRLFKTEPQTSLPLNHKVKITGLYTFILIGILIALPTIWKPAKNNAVKELALRHQETKPVNPIIPAGVELARNVRYINPASPIREVARQIKPARKIKPVERNRRQTPKPVREQDYVDALVNEELLAPGNEVSAVATHAAQIEGIVDSVVTYYVKIDEQQSGEMASQSYVFELANKGGAASIKPLIMLNKIKVPAKKLNKKSGARAVATRKVRTTS